MPKEFRQRVRRHARAAGYEEEEKQAGAGDAMMDALDDIAPSPASSAAPASGLSAMDVDAGDGKSTAQASAAPAPVAPAAASEPKQAKPKTKLERRAQKRKAFRAKLLLPGEPAKFQLSSLNTLGSLTSSLEEATEAESSQPAGAQKKRGISKKQKKLMANRDISNFSAVLSHPAFRANPLAAIREHLQNKEAIEQQQKLKAQQVEKKAAHLEQMLDEISDSASSSNANSAAQSKSAGAGAGSHSVSGSSAGSSSSGLSKSARRRQSRKKKSLKGSSSSSAMEDE